MTMTNKKKTIHADAEYGVDSRYKSAGERKHDSVALMEARLERMKELPQEHMLRAKLLQLKLNMENYLRAPIFDHQSHFTLFLASYIDILYSRRSEFANDINVTPVFLSQVINGHRPPKETFILKLMIHSEKAFKKVGGFEETIWYKIYFHEILGDIMSNQKKWRPQMEKEVKLSESLVK